MRTICSLVFAGVLVAFMVGCGKSAEENAVADTISKMKDEVAILKGVTDEASAKAAAPKIKAIHDELAKLQASSPTTTDPQAAAKVVDKYGKDLTDVATQLATEQTRIMSDPKLSAALGDALAK